jgi:hypothetical protein
MQRPEIVTIEGWFYINEKGYPNLDRTVIDDSVFKLSVRSFKINELALVNIERIIGSFFNPVYVQGVVHTKGSLIPFFIHRQKVRKLQELIESSQNQVNVSL